jgi:hypothetical protein
MDDRDDKCIYIYSWKVEGQAHTGHNIEAHEEPV